MRRMNSLRRVCFLRLVTTVSMFNEPFEVEELLLVELRMEETMQRDDFLPGSETVLHLPAVLWQYDNV